MTAEELDRPGLESPYEMNMLLIMLTYSYMSKAMNLSHDYIRF
jgi:hypothetical protein